MTNNSSLSFNFSFYSFLASVSFDFETRIMLTCMSTSRSNYIDMSIWKKYADHCTALNNTALDLGHFTSVCNCIWDLLHIICHCLHTFLYYMHFNVQLIKREHYFLGK